MEVTSLPAYDNLDDLKKALRQSLGENIVFLISCTKRKLDQPAKAEKMYSKSPVFRKKLSVASEIVPQDHVFVLSAKHGLLSLNTVIEPYDVSLKNKNKQEKLEWGNKVLEQLRHTFPHTWSTTYYVVMAGKDYYEPLLAYEDLKERIVLFFPKHFGNGKRHQYLNKLLSTQKNGEKNKS